MASLKSNNNLSGISDVIASQKAVNEEQAKLSGRKREILEQQEADIGTGFGALDLAEGLLKFAAADPEKQTSQQLAESFANMPAKMQTAAKEKRVNE